MRAALVTMLRDHGLIRTEPVAAAMGEIPRHVFLPDFSLDDAYQDDAVATKFDDAGFAISAASQPAVVAMMLEQLDVRPGHRVLEIGAGTGYNAALLGYLTGPTGHVTTIDVDADLVEGAAAHLASADVENVTAVLADGALGYPDRAPYDRIIATVGAGDLPPAWLDQVRPDGIVVLPLRLRGSVSCSIAFERDRDADHDHDHDHDHDRDHDGTWHSSSIEMCMFMPLRGIADDARRVIALTEDELVTVQVHQDQQVDPEVLAQVLDHSPTEVLTGVVFKPGEFLASLDLWLACALPGGLSRMRATGTAVESGLVRPQFFWGGMAAVEDGSIAYLTMRDTGISTDKQVHEIAVIGHGPRGGDLAERTAAQIRTWDHEHRSRFPTFRIAQGAAREQLTGQFVIDKPATRIAVTWA